MTSSARTEVLGVLGLDLRALLQHFPGPVQIIVIALPAFLVTV